MAGVFISLLRGNRMSQYLGLKMDEGVAYKYAKDYAYVEIPIREFYNPAAESIQKKALRGQHVRVVPACSVDIKGGFRYLVKTNPALQEVATCPTVFLLDVDDKEQPHFYATFRKDLDADRLDWCVRIYMIGEG